MLDILQHINRYSNSYKYQQRSFATTRQIKTNLPNQASRLTMWQKMINDLLALNSYSIVRIAVEVRTSRDTIVRVHAGITKTPRCDIGAAILALHLWRCPSCYAQTPLSRQVCETLERQFQVPQE